MRTSKRLTNAAEKMPQMLAIEMLHRGVKLWAAALFVAAAVAMAAATPDLTDTSEVPTHISCWPGDQTGDYYS